MKHFNSSSSVLIAMLLLISSYPAALEAGTNNFKMESVTLPQPDEVLKSRISGAPELADYIRKIVSAATDTFDQSKNVRPMTGAIVVAVKPNYRSKSWFMVSDGQIPSEISSNFQNKFTSIKPMAVRGGPIAFAIHFTTNGGGKPFERKDYPMPYPPEWKDAVRKLDRPVLVPDGILAIIWPN